jgi:hypothetical protein
MRHVYGTETASSMDSDVNHIRSLVPGNSTAATSALIGLIGVAECKRHSVCKQLRSLLTTRMNARMRVRLLCMQGGFGLLR